MPPLWNPRLLLDVDPFTEDFSCTGTTQKGSRCGQKFIDRKAESSGILDSLSRKDFVRCGMDERMRAQLRTLAENTLCPRRHRNGTRSQTEQIYAKWSQIISNFIAEERTRMNEEIQRPTTQPREVLAAPLANEGRSRHPGENRQARQENARPEALADIQRLLDDLHRRIDAAEAAHAVLSRVEVPVPARQEGVVLSPPVRDNAVVENDNLQPRVRPVRLEVTVGRARRAVGVETPQAELPTPPQSPVHQHGGRTDMNRKSLTAGCYTCYEPFEGSDDAVWCRRTCGQNVHKKCFEEWSRGKEIDEVSCGYCRANWLWE